MFSPPVGADMRIAIVGPGALGCFFAARMAQQQDHEVWLLDHLKERADLLDSAGLKLIEREKTFSVKVRAALCPEEIGRADLIIFCVKSHDVSSAIERVRPLAADDNLLIAFQNGIAHHRVLQEEYPGPWALGVTAQGAALEGPGIVRHGGDGATIIGFASPEERFFALLEKSAQIFEDAGINTEVSRKIRIHVWRKFVVNVGINALSVILNCPNGKICDSPLGRERLAKAVAEAVLVASAKDIEVGADPLAMTENVCKSTSINISSMLQDVRLKKKTEIEAINGALVREARMLGISVPENEKLVREVKAIEAQYLF